MGKFSHIAKALADNRRVVGLTQYQLSQKLGYKNGQLVSNIERGIQSLPPKYVLKTSSLLNISPCTLERAMIEDFKEDLSTKIKEE